MIKHIDVWCLMFSYSILPSFPLYFSLSLLQQYSEKEKKINRAESAVHIPLEKKWELSLSKPIFAEWKAVHFLSFISFCPRKTSVHPALWESECLKKLRLDGIFLSLNQFLLKFLLQVRILVLIQAMQSNQTKPNKSSQINKTQTIPAHLRSSYQWSP